MGPRAGLNAVKTKILLSGIVSSLVTIPSQTVTRGVRTKLRASSDTEYV
jgi:hypothetical protein